MLNEHITVLYASLYGLLELTALAAAGHAIMNTRSSQGTIAWVLSLVAVPFIALPMYLFLGQRKFYGYVKARRAGDVRIKDIPEDFVRQCGPDVRAPLGADMLRWQPLERLAKMPFLRGNRATLLIDGEATFNAIFDAIDQAKDYILVQFYIVTNDQLGQQLKQRLLARRRDGIRIFFLYDAVGSYQLPRDYVQELAQAGVDIRAFTSSKRASGNRFRINFRNHRKIVVVDGRQAFVGGHNVGDDYLGKHPRLSPWRDTHVQLRGPAALGVQLTFLEDWNWVAGSVPKLSFDPVICSDSDQHVLILPTGPADTLDTCSLFFVHAINSATDRVWIVSPYFVPDEPVVAALQMAALRGVDVRVLLPARADHRLVHLAGYSYFRETLGAGVKLYRYEKGFLHQKVMLVDNDLAAVGTANADNRSFSLNFEITVLIADRLFALQMAAMLDLDFASSRAAQIEDFEQRALPFRIAVRTARLFAPVL